jgi:hypothetical protein
MGKPSKQLMDFMAAYKVDSDEVWEVRAGGAWAIKHSAIERVAAENKITFDPPVIIEGRGADKIVAMLVTAKMGERVEWSIGEASPSNYRTTEKMAAYPYAMAEKRGKDRVVLKLLNAHGAVYSDSEADDFASNGKPATLPKKDAKEIYTKMQAEIRACQSREQLKLWGEANKDRINVLPEDWQDILRLQYEEMAADLRNREAA